MAEGEKTYKKRNGTEIRLLETRYGVKILVKQGTNKVWLSQNHIMEIFSAILTKAFQSQQKENTY